MKSLLPTTPAALFGAALLLGPGLGGCATTTPAADHAEPPAAPADPADPAGHEKLIRIGPAPSAEDRLAITVRADKSGYRVNEPIRLQVKGNKTFHLYLFNIDPVSKRGLSILPNRYQGADRIKYKGGVWHAVPNANLQFYSDRPGNERIVLLASEKHLDVDRLLKEGGAKGLGDFYSLETPLDALDEALSDRYREKRIHVRERTERLPPGVVVQELDLSIRR